jgi:altronate dehydratase small subunit
VEGQEKAVVLNPEDNVATALFDLKGGTLIELTVGGRRFVLELKAAIPFGHKVSLTDIMPGGSVIKYGEVIGRATQTIRPGDYVHVHNVASTRGRGDLKGDQK